MSNSFVRLQRRHCRKYRAYLAGRSLAEYLEPRVLLSATPSFSSLSLVSNTINEGQSATITGTISDADNPDDFVLEIQNWGDGIFQGVALMHNMAINTSTIHWNPTTRVFSILHMFADPNGAPYSIPVDVFDSDNNLSPTSTLNLTVQNVAPTITLAATASANTGVTFNATGSSFDPGVHDGPWSETINYGDGSSPVTFNMSSNSYSFPLSHNYTAPGTYTVTVQVTDQPPAVNGPDATALTGTASMMVTISNVVANRLTFYGGSAFDVGGHDNAIAPDKTALLPGQNATFSNYTSYDRGVNGIMVDITGAVSGLTGTDFVLKTGNDNSPGSWTTLGAPTINLRNGAGTGGSNRIELTLPNNTVVGAWLQVTVLADGHTGLKTDDVFYFGNAPGESGNLLPGAQYAIVNSVDEIGARAFPADLTGSSNAAAMLSLYDYNRDKHVDALDEGVAGAHYTSVLNALMLISPPPPSGPLSAGGLDPVVVTDAIPLGWPVNPVSNNTPTDLPGTGSGADSSSDASASAVVTPPVSTPVVVTPSASDDSSAASDTTDPVITSSSPPSTPPTSSVVPTTGTGKKKGKAPPPPAHKAAKPLHKAVKHAFVSFGKSFGMLMRR